MTINLYVETLLTDKVLADQVWDLIGQVLIHQQGFDVEFSKHADRMSAALRLGQISKWAECLLSPKADAQTANISLIRGAAFGQKRTLESLAAKAAFYKLR